MILVAFERIQTQLRHRPRRAVEQPGAGDDLLEQQRIRVIQHHQIHLALREEGLKIRRDFALFEQRRRRTIEEDREIEIAPGMRTARHRRAELQHEANPPLEGQRRHSIGGGICRVRGTHREPLCRTGAIVGAAPPPAGVDGGAPPAGFPGTLRLTESPGPHRPAGRATGQRRAAGYNGAMAESRLMTDEERAQARRWLETWARVGPILEEERWARLHAMTPEELQNATRQVWELWQRDWPTDDGEGLLSIQRVLARLRDRT